MGMQIESFNAKSITASTALSTSPCTMKGILCCASASGIINVRDGGASGTVIVGPLTLVAGQFYPIPAGLSAGLYIELVSGTFTATPFWA